MKKELDCEKKQAKEFQIESQNRLENQKRVIINLEEKLKEKCQDLEQKLEIKKDQVFTLNRSIEELKIENRSISESTSFKLQKEMKELTDKFNQKLDSAAKIFQEFEQIKNILGISSKVEKGFAEQTRDLVLKQMTKCSSYKNFSKFYKRKFLKEKNKRKNFQKKLALQNPISHKKSYEEIAEEADCLISKNCSRKTLDRNFCVMAEDEKILIEKNLQKEFYKEKISSSNFNKKNKNENNSAIFTNKGQKFSSSRQNSQSKSPIPYKNYFTKREKENEIKSQNFQKKKSIENYPIHEQPFRTSSISKLQSPSTETLQFNSKYSKFDRSSKIRQKSDLEREEENGGLSVDGYYQINPKDQTITFDKSQNCVHKSEDDLKHKYFQKKQKYQNLGEKYYLRKRKVRDRSFLSNTKFHDQQEEPNQERNSTIVQKRALKRRESSIPLQAHDSSSFFEIFGQNRGKSSEQEDERHFFCPKKRSKIKNSKKNFLRGKDFSLEDDTERNIKSDLIEAELDQRTAEKRAELSESISKCKVSAETLHKVDKILRVCKRDLIFGKESSEEIGTRLEYLEDEDQTEIYEDELNNSKFEQKIEKIEQKNFKQESHSHKDIIFLLECLQRTKREKNGFNKF